VCVCVCVCVELVYEDVFTVWETIWAAQHVSSSQLVLFIALALVECYREIIIDNDMDFTDIIRFFNGQSVSQSPSLGLRRRIELNRFDKGQCNDSM